MKRKKNPTPRDYQVYNHVPSFLIEDKHTRNQYHQHCLASPHSSLQFQSLENSDREIKQLVQSNTAGDEGDGSEGQAQHLVAVRYIITENTYLSCSFHCTFFRVLLSSPPFPLLPPKKQSYSSSQSKPSICAYISVVSSPFIHPETLTCHIFQVRKPVPRGLPKVTERGNGRVVIKLSYI